MNKKLITALVALTVLIPTAANAAFKTEASLSVPPTVAVLDTALDGQVNTFAGKIVQEVCILDWASCPNGQKFMEGKDAALLPYKFISKNGFDHGTQMTSVLTESNPDVKIVFVRIVGNSAQGSRQITQESTFVNALNWVIQNKDRLNIQAVAMSQGHHNLLPGQNYCPNTPNTVSKIKTLVAMQVPVFLPAGNTRDYSRIDWPACITEAIAIGAATDYDEIPIWSNMDVNKVDFYTLGVTTAMSPTSLRTNVSGTSVAVQVAAAQWMAIKKAKPELSYTQIYDLLKRKSVKILNPKGLAGDMINLKGALSE